MPENCEEATASPATPAGEGGPPVAVASAPPRDDDDGGSSSSSSGSSSYSSSSSSDGDQPALPGGIPRRLSIPLTVASTDAADVDDADDGATAEGGAADRRSRDQLSGVLATSPGSSASALADADEDAVAAAAAAARFAHCPPSREMSDISEAGGVNHRRQRPPSSSPPPPSAGPNNGTGIPPVDDELAKMMSRMMQEHASKVGSALAERATLVESINWLGNHVPGCVLASLSQEMEVVLREERRKEKRKKWKEEARKRRLAAAEGGGCGESDDDDDDEDMSDRADDHGGAGAALRFSPECSSSHIDAGGQSSEAARGTDDAGATAAEEAEGVSPQIVGGPNVLYRKRSESSMARLALGIGTAGPPEDAATMPPSAAVRTGSDYVDPFPYDSDDSQRKRERAGKAGQDANDGKQQQRQEQVGMMASKETITSGSSLSHSHLSSSHLSGRGGRMGHPSSSLAVEGERVGAMILPHATRHESALLFVDISGFTKLSTALDVESLSKAINAYFQMIVNEVTSHGGDVLKFAGDALFAEWQATPRPKEVEIAPDNDGSQSSLAQSTAPWHGMDLSKCVSVAAACGAKIVSNCSDFAIFRPGVGGSTQGAQVATLNVHCGLGVGDVAGIHVGDDEKRREYLIVGDVIDQIAAAEGAAALGELAASPKFVDILSKSCTLEDSIRSAKPGKPVVIASRSMSYFQPKKRRKKRLSTVSSTSSQPTENLAIQCEGMKTDGLTQLRKLIALYVHPVVVNDEIATQKQPGSRATAQERHRAEAELRSVYTMFIMPLINAKVTGNDKEDTKLFKLLNDIMNLTTRELDRFQGHLRQFIVDDKGVVLIATFGLRGATFPNMVAERALPATTMIHNALQTELGVDNQVGGTIGNVYCGVVGGIKRHEFAVLGPSVNLSARLMASPDNPGILVDNNVRLKAGKFYSFNALPPIKAKGYAEPVPIFEPLSPRESRWGKPLRNFVGRKQEVRQLMTIATEMASTENKKSQLVFLSSESGTGKSSMLVQALALTRKHLSLKRRRLVITRNVSNEGDSLIPFSMFRSTFLDVLSELQTDDASMSAAGNVSCGGFSVTGDFPDHMSTLSEESGSTNLNSAVERLLFVAKELDAPPEFTEIVGHHLLGFERRAGMKADNKKSKAPPSQEIVDFMARAFVRCTSHVDLVILALDDVHLMDDMSWKVVQALFDQGRNVLIICASRPTSAYNLSVDGKFWDDLKGRYQAESRFREMQLKPLDENDILMLIAKTLGYDAGKIDEKLKREVFVQCGGMPDFASEILQNVKRENLVKKLENGKIGWSDVRGQGGEGRGTAMFSSVGELILHRMDSLDAAVRKVLHVAAVFGLNFELMEVVGVTEQLLGIQDRDRPEQTANTRAALDKAVQEGILEEVFEGGQEEKEGEAGEETTIQDSTTLVSVYRSDKEENKAYRFSHDMWRTNILKLLLGSRQRDIHRSIAQALEAQQREEDDDYRSRIKLFSHWKASGDSIKACDLALSIGKNFEELGLHVQASRIYDDALDMWRTDEKSDDDEMIAGYSTAVLDTIDASDLENMIKIHIALGKVLANQRRGKDSVVAYQNALQILQNSPASEELEDRSIVFPIFSGLFVLLKFGDIEQDDECSYEQDLVRKFVNETRLNGDPVHYTRALAMQGEMYGRLGDWDSAFKAHNKLVEIYNADEHSAGVCKSYGSDRSAQSFGQSARWHMHQGNADKALETCRYIVDELMPKMEPRNVHNSAVMLWPVTWVMKDNGLTLEARANFDKFVVQAFQEHYGEGASTFCLPIYTPTLMLLDLAGNQGAKIERMDEYLLWALSEDNYSYSATLNGAMGNLSRDADSLAAEICLLLANRTEGEIRNKLIKSGLEKARASVETTRPKDGKGGMINAYDQVKLVHEELEQMATAMDTSAKQIERCGVNVK